MIEREKQLIDNNNEQSIDCVDRDWYIRLANRYPAGTIRLSTSYFTTNEDFKELTKVLDYIEENI